MTTTKTAFLAVLLVISITVYLTPIVSSQTGSNVTIHFIDVGQGDSIFVDTANKDVLLDAGSASASQTVLDYLADLDITHVHLLIATHMHADHIGGLVDVLNSALTIDEVLINNQTHNSDTYEYFNTTLQTHTITIAQRGQTIILTETANLTVLNPTQPLEFSDLNDNSIVVKLQAGNTSFLFTGDAEEDAEVVEIFKCPECGAEISSDTVECPSCGTEFAELEEVPEVLKGEEMAEAYECPECGFTIDADDTSCPNCGTTFEEEIELFACPACGEPSLP